MKKLSIFLLWVMIISLMVSCGGDTKVKPAPEVLTSLDAGVDFPKLSIPGFKFPEDSLKLNGWISENNTEAIHKHAWGIWAGLTTPTNQKVGNESLLVYQTWLSPRQIIDSVNKVPVKPYGAVHVGLSEANQHRHFKTFSLTGQFATGGADTVSVSIQEGVAYSPTASLHAYDNQIFKAQTLLGYMKDDKNSINKIPDFPNTAILVKPVYKVLKIDAKHPEQIYFPIAAWNGNIPKNFQVLTEKGYPEQDWENCVYIDITNGGLGTGKQIPFKFRDSTLFKSANESNGYKFVRHYKPVDGPTPENTFNLNDFIYYTLTRQDIGAFKKNYDDKNIKAGDIVVLVGMHVTTKENKRWTWQTFWWAPDAANPPFPSSAKIAALRPAELVGAAKHYAMATAYYMVNPKEPYNGSQETIFGEGMYAFNPYLESGFAEGTFDSSISYFKTASGAEKTNTYVGVRTNCMSCHALATVNKFDLLSQRQNPGITPYSGDAYIGLDNSLYKGQLQLDFAWSIQGNVDYSCMCEYLESLEYKK